MSGNEATKRRARAFWDEVYRVAYSETDAALDAPGFSRGLEALEDMFRRRGHLAAVEMPLNDLNGKHVLEIGSGAGAHSALFARHGAIMTSIDLAFDRAAATAAKFRLLDASPAAAVQADAERLPFADSTFDIVYSNGVLHHTPGTEAAIAELWRVLKPDGRAVVMLYCKSSFHYWFTLVFCIGVLKGGIFRGRDWMGRATEWIGRAPQTIENPVTKCYSAAALRRLFARFVDVRLRKSEFEIRFIPKLGRLYERWQRRRYGVHPGGVLVYGAPWPITAPIERRLGRYVGWAWNVSAVKPCGRPTVFK